MSTSDFDFNLLWQNILAFYNSSEESLLSRSGELVLSKDFWDGLALGIQNDVTDESTLCHVSYNALYTLITTADLEFLTYAATTLSKGETPSDLGFFMQLFESMAEFQIVFFNVYSDCYIESLLIQLGKITNSNAGAGDFLVVVGTSLLEYFYLETGYTRALDAALQLSDLRNIGL